MTNRGIEVKALEIDIKRILLKLKELGAENVGDFLYKRIIFQGNSLNKKHAWLRLRTDVKKTTMTYKKVHSKKLDGKEEQEIVVDDFERTRKILKGIGLKEKRRQESRRLMLSLNGVEIDIDIWPMIPPHMEVEAKTVSELKGTLKRLGIDIKNTHTYTGRELYAHYNINLGEHTILKLEKDKKVMKVL